MSWHQLCKLDELPLGMGREFVVGSQVIAVFRTDNAIYAIDGMCAHQGGPLAQGELAGDCLTCPWHGWQYDVTNGKNLLTGRVMLECYTTEIRESEIWLELPD